jgi:hypothetical protein
MSKNFYSEFRQRDPSRERSRDDNKSKHSHSSQKSSKSNRSGPVIFGGNAVIKKTEQIEEQSAEILSRPEFRKPSNKIKNMKDVDYEDEYAAWAWEQAQK